MVQDESQAIYVNDKMIIWLNLEQSGNLIVNIPSLPTKPSDVNVYDTSADYRKERVSHGYSYSGDPIKDGTSIDFCSN